MQGNTTPYQETRQEQEVETERTQAHDKEIIQKYIHKQPKTEILEQTNKDIEDDKSLLKKYLKPENTEVSEEKLNRPKLNDPEDQELIKKFITDPTSKKEDKTKTKVNAELGSVGKLKYSKPGKKSKSEPEVEKVKTELPEKKVVKKSESSPEDRKEAILSIISSFGKKTKNEPQKEEIKTESKTTDTTIKTETNKKEQDRMEKIVEVLEKDDSVEEPKVEDSPSTINPEKVVEELKIKDEDSTSKIEAVEEPKIEVEDSVSKSEEVVEEPKDKHYSSKLEEIVEKTEIKIKDKSTQKPDETVEKTTTPKEEPKTKKKERPKLKESIIVGSEDILKPKKDKEIPIKEVSSLLDSDMPKPKPKESINVSSKQVSDAISYAMGESTTTILKVDELTESPQDSKTKDHIQEPTSNENGDIKPFFGFKVGSDKETETEITDLPKPTSFVGVKVDKETPNKEKPHKKPVFSESVKDSVITTKPEKDKKPVFKKTKNTNNDYAKNEIKSDSKAKLNGFKKFGETDVEKPSNKLVNSNRPVFAVKSNDELLNSEKLKTENRPKIDTTKSISDFKKDKETKDTKKVSKTKDVNSTTIYPTKQKEDKSDSSIMTKSDDTNKSESDDENKRQKILLGGTILGIILLILAAFGISALMTPSDTTLYVDDTALAPNDTNINNTTTYAPTTASSYSTINYGSTNDYDNSYQNDYNQRYRNSNQSYNSVKQNNTGNSGSKQSNSDINSDKPSTDESTSNSSKNTNSNKTK